MFVFLKICINTSVLLTSYLHNAFLALGQLISDKISSYFSISLLLLPLILVTMKCIADFLL